MMGEKKVKGRKRHILVDTLGNLLGILVHAADVQDREGAEAMLDHFLPAWRTIRRIWADQGYTGGIIEYAATEYDVVLDIVKKDPQQSGFAVLAKRWIVERTIAWLSRFRRLSKDYEYYPENSESFAYIASIRRLLTNLTTQPVPIKPHRARFGRRYRG